ncbi:hypothetical protein EVG20_g990 [Dentipellis fragilis]|uniref:Delta(14)-sterol reductase n=1 Tax=Dentipellis fragilis TaxID=205917 RepID=A0A4Y9ZBR8_9AGAM|nr:hypothetical protein EVG20_g990 [Dentipellis fragilis]
MAGVASGAHHPSLSLPRPGGSMAHDPTRASNRDIDASEPVHARSPPSIKSPRITRSIDLETAVYILQPAVETDGARFQFYIGRELNPTVGSLDVKSFNELRPGMILWLLIDISMACAQATRLGGRITDSMALVLFFQGLYIVDALYNETALLTTMDIISDGFGFMLSVGDLVWVPFVYSLQARYLAFAPKDLGYPACAGILGVNFLGYWIFRSANNEKNEFRNGRNPKNLKFMTTERGSKLLTSGWWGASRHPNYMGDLIMALAWSLPTGFDTPITYFYVIYFAGLLIHRQRRDDENCEKKYGKDWRKYMELRSLDEDLLLLVALVFCRGMMTGLRCRSGAALAGRTSLSDADVAGSTFLFDNNGNGLLSKLHCALVLEPRMTAQACGIETPYDTSFCSSSSNIRTRLVPAPISGSARLLPRAGCPQRACDLHTQSHAPSTMAPIAHTRSVLTEHGQYYECEECGKHIQRRTDLGRHMRDVHTYPKLRPYSCRWCRKTFKNISNLKTHERRHSGERLTCPNCDTLFTDEGTRTRHRKEQHGYRPYHTKKWYEMRTAVVQTPWGPENPGYKKRSRTSVSETPASAPREYTFVEGRTARARFTEPVSAQAPPVSAQPSGPAPLLQTPVVKPASSPAPAFAPLPQTPVAKPTAIAWTPVVSAYILDREMRLARNRESAMWRSAHDAAVKVKVEDSDELDVEEGMKLYTLRPSSLESDAYAYASSRASSFVESVPSSSVSPIRLVFFSNMRRATHNMFDLMSWSDEDARRRAERKRAYGRKLPAPSRGRRDGRIRQALFADPPTRAPSPRFPSVLLRPTLINTLTTLALKDGSRIRLCRALKTQDRLLECGFQSLCSPELASDHDLPQPTTRTAHRLRKPRITEPHMHTLRT